jgi:hypothetical protein
MPTQRVRAADRIQRALRWDRKYALLAADRVIAAGKYDTATEATCYDSTQWLNSLTDDQLNGTVPAPPWFPNLSKDLMERLIRSLESRLPHPQR